MHSNGPVWDDGILDKQEVTDAIANSGSVKHEGYITNVQRSAFGRIGGAVARQWGDRGFAGSLDFVLRGSGGQSFGCFMVRVLRRALPFPGAACMTCRLTLLPRLTLYPRPNEQPLQPSRV